MTLHIGQPCLSAGCVQWCCENSKSSGHEIKPVLGLDGQVLGLRRSLQQCLCFMSHENAATRKSAAGFRAAFDQFSTSWRHVQAGLSPGLWPAFDWIDSMECGLRSLAGLVLFITVTLNSLYYCCFLRWTITTIILDTQNTYIRK